MNNQNNNPDFIRPGMTGDATPKPKEVEINHENEQAFIPETAAQDQLRDRQTPREGAQAHIDDEPNTERLVTEGNYGREQAPNAQDAQDRESGAATRRDPNWQQKP